MKRLLREIGFTGLAALALLAAALLFSAHVVAPMEARNAALQSRAAGKPAAQPSGAKVAAVYAHLKSAEEPTDLLAKLHAVGVASGVQLKSATYRAQKTEGRIERTEIVLPVAGSYSQIRDFLQRALVEIPVLSLDSLSLKRGEGALQAEMRLTLHMVRS